MSVYVCFGICLLYKGFKFNNMEKKCICKLFKFFSIKQGKKYDDFVFKVEIFKFIVFYGLDLFEVLFFLDQFKNFNEFFYCVFKFDVRLVFVLNNLCIVVFLVDCRFVVFNCVDIVIKVWIKGREFSVKCFLGDVCFEDVYCYEVGGVLGIFRLVF